MKGQRITNTGEAEAWLVFAHFESELLELMPGEVAEKPIGPLEPGQPTTMTGT